MYWGAGKLKPLFSPTHSTAVMVTTWYGLVVEKPKDIEQMPSIHHTVVPITPEMDEACWHEHARLRDFDDLEKPILVIKYDL